MNNLKYFTVLLFIFLSATITSAQQDTAVLNNISSKLQLFTKAFPVEKVYLHFDKPYYSVGDTIWFKAYVTSEQNQPSQLSKIVYADIINGNDSLIATIKLPVANGAAYGNIPLDKENFQQGNHYVRAYTAWMMNFDADYFFNKNILIGEAIDKQMVTHISFITSADKKVTARIVYKGRDGKPYGMKQVNWQILTNFDAVAKGKGVTDANGVLNILLNGDPKKPVYEPNSKLLTLVNAKENEPPVATTFSLKDLKGKNDLQFFPEGGDIILGIPVQVAFKG
ncbi:MAG: carboxypeptidase regulatory-like domain-containing protein, partial [Pedobacter sp.]